MANLPIPSPLTEVDYEQIEGAVMETARGRWFLAEYARRNRNADTTMLLKALERIEANITGKKSVDPVDRMRFDLIEMSKAISRTKAEIASIKPDADQSGKFGEASEELDSVVQATETATSDILACAERIQEMAWTLREQGVESEVCDLLDANATEVYTACSFQDITGQRTRKVIGVLRYLEERINAMIGIWGLDGTMAAEAAEQRAVDEDKALLNGPAKPGMGLDQADVDMVMGPATAKSRTRAMPADAAPIIDAEAVEAEPVSEPRVLDARPSHDYEIAPPLQPADHHAAPVELRHQEITHREIEHDVIAPPPRVHVYRADTDVIDAEVIEAPVARAPVAQVVDVQAVEIRAAEPVHAAPRAINHDALAPVMALSAEERIALFS